MTLPSPQLLAGLALFAFVSSITPGPNNTMLMASGANFGFRASWAHMAGVSLGFGLMVLVLGFGLGQIFRTLPWLHGVLAVVGGSYMVWLAWKIATADGIGAGGATTKPQTFLQAAGFQWLNPKAWAMGLGAVTTYAPTQNYGWNVVGVSLVFIAINLPCIMVWTGFGVGLRQFLDRPAMMRGFNWLMACLLLLSLVPMFGELRSAALGAGHLSP